MTSIISKHLLTPFYNQMEEALNACTQPVFTAGVMNRSWIIQAVTESGKFTTFYSHFSLLWIYFSLHHAPRLQVCLIIYLPSRLLRVLPCIQVSGTGSRWTSKITFENHFDGIWDKVMILSFPQKLSVGKIKSVNKTLSFQRRGKLYRKCKASK